MGTFTVDDDLVELVWKKAKPRPFENLTFSAALRRVLHERADTEIDGGDELPELDELLAESPRVRTASAKKAPSPSAMEWVASVPELRGKKGLTSWQAICSALKINTAGDSARRKLRNWVKANRPNWPEVPSIEGDA